ncbi:(2Fe-2S) ferredoxin domain-containing protein [Candidatus Clostridium stratigraminis]|uniref:(2Fe-2S) ferredoxin domain-containing protein n=1 Tax=Candidatus Clostridium stratigraminis TaxID=3381661 RepID=A0ABW8T664_9CLOT
MKTIEELEKIRKKTFENINPGINRKNPRIVIGMATCGIAAGAMSVMGAIIDELKRNDINNVIVAQTGCIGICKLEPVVEVYMPGKEKVTYVKMNVTRVRRMIYEHVIGGKTIDEYTMHLIEGKVLNDYTVLDT